MGIRSPFNPIKSKTVVFKLEKLGIVWDEDEPSPKPYGVELLAFLQKNLKKLKNTLDKNDRFWSAWEP